MSLTASSRSAENAPRMRRFSSSSTACSVAAAEDRHGQQRAAVGPGEVRVAGEAVVAGRVRHHQRLTGPLDVAQHRHRHRTGPVAARRRRRAGRGSAAIPGARRSTAASCTPVAPVIAPSTSTTRACSRSMLVSELSACDAARIPSRSIVPVVTGATRLGGRRAVAPIGGVAGAGRPSPAARPWRSRPRRGTSPRAWASRSWPACSTPWARMEPGRALGDQRPVPRPLAAGDLAPRGVEGEHGGTEVAGRPGPLGLDQPQQVQEVVRRIRGPPGQPPRQLVQLGEQIARARRRPSARASSARARPRSRRISASGVEAVDSLRAVPSPRRCAAPGRPDRRRWRRRWRRQRCA